MTDAKVKLRRDFKGQMLCEPCFNNAHYGHKVNYNGKRTSVKFLRCLQGGCECLCRAVLAEQEAKRKAIA